jgi:hypothetical protein
LGEVEDGVTCCDPSNGDIVDEAMVFQQALFEFDEEGVLVDIIVDGGI